MSAITQAVSAALIHLVWQGAIVGLALWIALAALKHRSANARYAVSCAALATLVLLPILTVACVLSLHAGPIGATIVPSTATPRDIVGIPQTMLPIWMEPATPRFVWLVWLQAWALPIWSAGVLIFSVRLVLGCAHTFTLGRRGDSADESLLSMVAVLARRLKIVRPVRLLMSTRVDGPSVLGWLRPVILLPPAAAMGLTPRQLEAILAHELAHIRRHDYLVNVLQIVAETLFFYHPTVWWISKQIRTQRELCCDDLAVKSCGDALGYARALTTLERMRLTPNLAMAAAGGPLLYRIQRLLGAPTQEYGPSRWPGVLALCLGLTAVGLNVNWARLFAQDARDSPRFEVASVKPNTLNNGLVSMGTQGGRFTATGLPLRMLIQNAYQVQEDQIIGGPSWLVADRFDVQAKAEGNPPREQVQLMIRALLADRFKLAVHKETRDVAVFALVMARSDGRLGAQLRKVEVDCTPGRGQVGDRTPPNAASGPRRGCGTTVGPGVVMAQGQTIAQLATAFSALSNTGSSLNRPVVDRTGLTGTFDADLRFTPERIANGWARGAGGAPCISAPSAPGTSGGPVGPCLPPVDPNGPSIFTAVQEQLGLKLDPQRGPVDVLVIDRVERPTED